MLRPATRRLEGLAYERVSQRVRGLRADPERHALHALSNGSTARAFTSALQASAASRAAELKAAAAAMAT